MEQQDNNEPEELIGKDMNSELIDEEPANDSTPEQMIKKGGNVLVNSGTESLELELPSGVKISLSSGNQSVQELCGLCLWVFDEIKKRKIDGKENGGGYIN